MGRGGTDEATSPVRRGVSLANALILSRTTLIPRSSDAFSSSTLFLNESGLQEGRFEVRQRSRSESLDGRTTYPNSCFDRARMVLVFPVPGGP